MKKHVLVFAALIAASISVAANAAELKKYQPGPRLIDGSQLNQMVDILNGPIICPSYFATGNADTDAVFFIAPRRLLIETAQAIFSTTNGAALTLQVSKDSSTNAPGTGTDLLTTAFDLNLTANTVQNGVITPTVATKTLASGDRLAVDFSTTRTNLTGLVVTVCLSPF